MNSKAKIIAIAILSICAAGFFCGCQSVPPPSKSEFSRFVGFERFSNFVGSTNQSGERVLSSPVVSGGMKWDELVVSWNADAPAGTYVNIEARANQGDAAQSEFYALGNWSLDGKIFPRTSIGNQIGADGFVDTDTLILNQPAADTAQVRITLGGTNGAMPALKFLGLSFSNTKGPVATRLPNRAAWGSIIATPERSQHGYPDAKGWCSPAALAMVLSRWAEILNRPEMDLPVPEIAAAVYDRDYAGTGNWPFNTAFAGSFRGMRSCVSRFDDLSEVEDWIAAGIPVILSARWDLLQPGRPPDAEGHLIVCIGFTEDGDVVANDPATRLDQGETVRRIYKRENVVRAWAKSHNTVYLVYPETAKIPRNKYGHWGCETKFF